MKFVTEMDHKLLTNRVSNINLSQELNMWRRRESMWLRVTCATPQCLYVIKRFSTEVA